MGPGHSISMLAKRVASAPHARRWYFAIFLLAFRSARHSFPFMPGFPMPIVRPLTLARSFCRRFAFESGDLWISADRNRTFPCSDGRMEPTIAGVLDCRCLYGGLAAWMQTDFKRLIAYSSFSHVNFILAGIFVWNQMGHEGAILQALNHGVTIAGFFIVAGWLKSGLVLLPMGRFMASKCLPQLCWLTLIFVLSSVALPGTNNFVGEM